jgi:hypothetical protein
MRLPLMCAVAMSLVPALVLPLASTSTATEAAPLTGTYDCQGVEPDGTPYRGIVQITPNRNTYDVLWIFATGQQYAGLGVLNGDVLAVSYFTNRPGVVAYKIENGDKGPRLQGQWTVVGAGAVFRETLTRVSREVKRPEPPPQPRRNPTPFIGHLRPA